MSADGWAVIAWDEATGVTLEYTARTADDAADHVASWAQQEADRWPELGLLYMLVEQRDVPKDERPPKPYHRWAANEQPDWPLSLDRCLACGVRRFGGDRGTRLKAAGPCPQTR